MAKKKTKNYYYSKSDSHLTVDADELSYKEYYALTHCGKKAENRKKAAQALCDYLCDKFQITHCKVWVADRMYPTRYGHTYMGLYWWWHKVITIYNNMDFMTPCTNRSFADVLLHEFMHHYDYYYLNLSESVHSKGFYLRIRDLKAKLKKPKK